MCGGKHSFDTRQNNPVGQDGSTVSKQVFYIRQCLDEDRCSYSQQCVEENTVLTQGRIILWARGSLADDGSTVSEQVFLYSTVLQ